MNGPIPVSAGTFLNDILGHHGVPGAIPGTAVDALSGNPAGALLNLHDAFHETAIGRGTTGYERLCGTACAPQFLLPPPSQAFSAAQSICGALYAPAVGGTRAMLGAMPAAAMLGAVCPPLGVGHLAAQGLSGALSGLMGAPFGFGMLPGAGAGSFNPNAAPGRLNNTNPLYERAHQAQVAGVMHDPSLAVEDKVTLMLMLIMKKMDRDIERQAQYISSIQQQQSTKKQLAKGANMAGSIGGAVVGSMVPGVGTAIGSKVGGMAGSMAGQALQSGTPSIDVETMKMKRMIDKRGQMFDMLRQIIDKYNETAKGIIQSIGR